MPGFAAKGAAPLGKVQEIVRVNSPGPIDFVIQNLGEYDLLMSFLRHGGDLGDRALYDGDEAYKATMVSSGESLETPVLPRSLKLAIAGSPTLYDRDGDGVLRILRALGAPIAVSVNTFSGGDGVTSVPATKQFTAASGDFVNRGVRVGDILQITNLKDAGKYVITARNSATMVTVDRLFPVGGLTYLSWAIYPSDLACGTVDYFTGKTLLAYPAGDAPGARACVLGTCTFPVALDPGMTLIVAGDHAGGGTATWDAGAATLAGGAASGAAMSNETMQIKVGPDSAPWQTIRFTTDADLDADVVTINAQLVGATAVKNVATIDISTTAKGTAARLRTRNVAAGITTKCGIANNGNAVGTGDVADINAVTYAEFASRISTDLTTILSNLEGTVPKLISNTAFYGSASTIQVTGGTGTGVFGFDLTAHTGADSGAEQGVQATYLTGVVIPAGKLARKSMVNSPHEEIIVGALGKGGSSLVSVEYQPIEQRL